MLWQGWSRDFNLEQVSLAGTLTGLRGIRSVNLVEARPHAVAGSEWIENEENQTVGDLGLDLNYLFSSNSRNSDSRNSDYRV